MNDFTIADIQPCKKYILVKPIERPKETTTGLVMPEEGYSPTPVVGEVIASGAESEYPVGTMVFFRRYSVDELKFHAADGKLVVVNMLSDEEVVATVKQLIHA